MEPVPGHELSPEATPAPDAAGLTTVPLPPARRSGKKVAIAGAVTLAVVIVIAAYLALTIGKQAARSSDTARPSGQSQSTGNKSVDDASATFTSGADDEANQTNSNDSKEADDATQSAATIGDSINESNF